MNGFTLSYINEKVKNNPAEFVEECENAYKKRINEITAMLCEKSGRSLVMLAGPSSSGKTTTAGIMKKNIEKTGRSATVVSLDDFYLDDGADYTFEDGTVDYETVKALDTDCINECMHSLMEKGRASLPHFSFQSKKREGFTDVRVSEDEIIILEGLHALNPVITEPLSDEQMLKLYISVSSRIHHSSQVLMTKRDMRFIRRLIRDYHFRGSQVEYTFYLWNGVRMGEDRYLFPFSSRADIKIDTIHPYETAVFKKEAEKLLDLVGENSIYYNAALELRRKLEHFYELDRKMIPEDSLLREFVG